MAVMDMVARPAPGWISVGASQRSYGPPTQNLCAARRRPLSSKAAERCGVVNSIVRAQESDEEQDQTSSLRPSTDSFSSRRQLLTATAAGVVTLALPMQSAALEAKSLYDFSVMYKDEEVPLSTYRDMFGGQAPGTSDEERMYAYKKFGFEFPVFDKIDVKGANMSPVYEFLKKYQPGETPWNYTKFLVDRNGKPVRRYSPGFDPVNFEEDVEALINRKPLPPKKRAYLGAP